MLAATPGSAPPSAPPPFPGWSGRALDVQLGAEELAPEQVRYHAISWQLVLSRLRTSAALAAFHWSCSPVATLWPGCRSTLGRVTDPSALFATPRVAAGALFLDDRGWVLLVHPTYNGPWDIPVGDVERGELPELDRGSGSVSSSLTTTSSTVSRAAFAPRYWNHQRSTWSTEDQSPARRQHDRTQRPSHDTRVTEPARRARLHLLRERRRRAGHSPGGRAQTRRHPSLLDRPVAARGGWS